MKGEQEITIKDQYYINPEKIDSNDRRQIKYLNEFDKEHN